MPILSRVGSLWRNLFRRGSVERELEAELASYVELLTDEKVRAGMDRAEAHRRALLEVGGVEQVKERVRDRRTGAALEVLIRDVRHGFRLLARTPGFTFAVVLSLALGVGGTTAIFAVVDAALLQPLPYPAADELYEVRVWWNDFSASLSPADVLALREEGQEVAKVGAWSYPDRDGFTWLSAQGPELVQGARVSRELPTVLGASPLLGRSFSADATAPEALIGERFWRERFAGSPEVLGRAIELEGASVTIVGVMPEGFDVPGQSGALVWASFRPEVPTRRGPFYMSVVARLADEGLPARAAQDRLSRLVEPVLRERYGVTEAWRYELRPLKEVIVGDVRPTLRLLFAAVWLTLLIGVLNFSSLLLARGMARRRELSVRAALGAGRGRLVRQLLVEAASVGLLSGAVGLMLAAAALGLFRQLAADVVPRIEEASLDPRSVAFALAVGIASGLVAGALPALRVPWSSLVLELREGGRSVGLGRRQGSARRVLVGAMVSLTLTVLACASLLVRSLGRLDAADPGFDAESVLTFRLSLPESSYPDSAIGRMATFMASAEDALGALPGVSAVGVSNALPPNRLEFSNDYTVEGPATGARGASDVAEWLLATPGYFRALRIPVLRGRAFEPSDREGAPAVAVVNEAFVRRHYAGSDPLGRRLKGGGWDADRPWTTIVGVVRDVPYGAGVWGGATATVYTAYQQNLWHRSPFFSLRTAGEPAALVAAAERAIRSVDPTLPLRDVATLEERMRDSAASPRLRGLVFGLLAAIALALALTGVFGLVSYEVTWRRREIAMRRALGATARQVVAPVIRSAMALVGVAIVVGLGGAVAAGRSLAGLLYGVSALDPLPLGAAAAAVGVMSLAACALPALRAARVAPMSVLREE